MTDTDIDATVTAHLIAELRIGQMLRDSAPPASLDLKAVLREQIERNILEELGEINRSRQGK